MNKPNRIFDLVRDGHMTMGEVRKIAKEFFDGKTTGAGPEGYIITAVALDDLPDNLIQWVEKAVLQFKVENVFDADSRSELEQAADEEAEAGREETGLEKGDFGDE